MMPSILTKAAAATLALVVLATAAVAQDAAAPEAAEAVEYALAGDTAFVFNTLLFLIGGFLVMWMAAGFAMLEAGMVRSKRRLHAVPQNRLYSIDGP